jgi:hypothetical protein
MSRPEPREETPPFIEPETQDHDGEKKEPGRFGNEVVRVEDVIDPSIEGKVAIPE